MAYPKQKAPFRRDAANDNERPSPGGSRPRAPRAPAPVIPIGRGGFRNPNGVPFGKRTQKQFQDQMARKFFEKFARKLVPVLGQYDNFMDLMELFQIAKYYWHNWGNTLLADCGTGGSHGPHPFSNSCGTWLRSDYGVFGIHPGTKQYGYYTEPTPGIPPRMNAKMSQRWGPTGGVVKYPAIVGEQNRYDFDFKIPIAWRIPAVDPFEQPINAPMPRPDPIPYPMIPGRPDTNPDRDPMEQPTRGPSVTPRPAPMPRPGSRPLPTVPRPGTRPGTGTSPNPGTNPAPGTNPRPRPTPRPGTTPAPRPGTRPAPGPTPTPTVPVWPINPAPGMPPGIILRPGAPPVPTKQPHQRRPPPPGTKEIKLTLPFRRLMQGFNLPTEFNDFMDAFWWALPKEVRLQAFRDNGYKRLRPDQQWSTVWKHLDKIDGAKTVGNLLQNEIGDRIGGYAGRLNSRAKRAAFDNFGHNFGAGFSTW